MKINLFCISLASIFGLVFAEGKNFEEKETKIIQTVENAIVDDFKPKSNSPLNSVKNYKLERENGFLKLSVENDLCEYYSVEQMSSSDLEKEVLLNIKAIENIGMFNVDIEIKNGDEIEESFSTTGYAFENDEGEKDIKFDINGTLHNASEIIKDDNTWASVVIGGGYTAITHGPEFGGDHIIGDAVEITQELLDYSTVYKYVTDIMEPMELDIFNPLPYIVYKAKEQFAINNYEANSSLEKLNGYITDQNDERFKEWKYGLLGNACDGGCPAISVYNLLYDISDVKPDLALIILCAELGNVDLGLGYLGGVAFNNEEMKQISSLLKDAYFAFLKPLIDSVVIPTVTTAMVLTGLCVGVPFEPISLSISLSVLMDTSVDNAIEVLVGRRNGEDFLIKAFINNDAKLKRCMFYDNFDSKIREEKYGIISYFHELVNRDVPNLFKGGHFAYVRREYKDGRTLFDAYNVWNCEGPDEVDDIYELFTNDPANRDGHFAGGYIIYN